MRHLRSYHWWITGALFVVAAALYIAGFGSGAGAFFAMGFFVELLVWTSLISRPTNSSNENSKP